MIAKFLKTKAAQRILILSLVVVGILILFKVTWWIAFLSVALIVVSAVGITFLVAKRQQKKFLARLAKFNIYPESGRVNPADLRRMYNSGKEARRDAVMIYCLANNNCPQSEAHNAFREMSPLNPKAKRNQMQMVAQMQASNRKGKGKGRGMMR